MFPIRRSSSGKPPINSTPLGNGKKGRKRETGNPFAPALARHQLVRPMSWQQEWEQRRRRGASGQQPPSTARTIPAVDMGCLISDAKLRGQSLSTVAANILYRADGVDYTPIAGEPIPYSPEAIVAAAVQSLHIPDRNVVRVEQDWTTEETRQQYSAMLDHEIHAWILTSPDERLPLIFINRASPPMPLEMKSSSSRHGWNVHSTPLWAVHLALCLFSLQDHLTRHIGYATPGFQVILPPFSEHEPAVIPEAHMFVKALFRMEDDCPHISPCPCNSVLAQLRHPPQRHPEMSGTLRIPPPPTPPSLPTPPPLPTPRPAPYSRPLHPPPYPRQTARPPIADYPTQVPDQRRPSGEQERYTPTPPYSRPLSERLRKLEEDALDEEPD